MTIKPIVIGGVTVPNNVFFAPLAGFSTAEMRHAAYKAGAGLCFTEMVSAKGLMYAPEASEDLLVNLDENKVCAVQIFGNEPEFIKKAAGSEYLKNYDIIDLNMGCPMPKIYNNGAGSALLKDLRLAEEIVKAAKTANKPVSVKIRIGLDDNHIVTEEFAKALEGAGADLITVHGRTKAAVYAGEVNFEEIARAKRAVKIPVIANGGIFTAEDAEILMDRTGADGVMVARGALENPLIFAEITGKTVEFTLKDLVKEQILLTAKRYGFKRAGVVLRSQIAYYLKGVRGGKKFKERAFKAENADELIAVVEEAL